MERRPSALADRRFDVVVIGGGILGACAARDAALRGLDVALVEAGDFASATSSNSLKVVHGGLRHLQHLDLAGMRNSVCERSTWMRLAPHLVDPMPVVIPLFGDMFEQIAFRVGVLLNDLLSADRNRDLPPESRIRDGDGLSRSEVLQLIPQLESAGVRAGIRFHDGRMYSSERLVLAVIVASAERGAVVVNHARCVGALVEGGQRVGVRVVDQLDGVEIPLRARVILNLSGPGAFGLTDRLLGRETAPQNRLSLAWNVVLPELGPQVAFALPGGSATPTGSGGKGPRRLFVVPWRGRTLLGTGHAPFRGDPASFTGLEAEHPVLREFFDEVNPTWPDGRLDPGDALLVHAGLLPAEANDDRGEVRLSRRPILAETGSGGCPIVTATTVKFTTSRRLAQDAVDRACRRLEHEVTGEAATSTPLPGAPGEGMDALRQSALAELGPMLPADVIEHLVRCHGTRYDEVLRWRELDPRWDERMEPGSPTIRAQLWHGVRSEMACTPDDLLRRRTEFGARGPIGDSLRAEAESILRAAKQQVIPR